MIRQGTVVYLKRNLTRKRPRPKAKVLYLMKDTAGGVCLDTRLEDFRYWNVADLERAKSQKYDDSNLD
jgi:hypothetical protein